MNQVAFIRHGPTAWNREGRLTGRADIPLSKEGRRLVACYRLPAALSDATWHTSPLKRARETAALLGHANARVEPRLIEMDFGAYEGRTLEELRAELGEEMRANEARGLDFQPPGGESPRMLQQRLRPFLAELGRAGGRHVAVAHKSVIRAVFAAAYDWPMTGRPPLRLRWDCAHLFGVARDGAIRPVMMNLTLVEP
ncbi:MAG TPA: histidine phosphatase family protein [Alphaproteobacteria bacterium]|nr:histidine phosphatase family protein [Alphaproteobacteria bacterium]